MRPIKHPHPLAKNILRTSALAGLSILLLAWQNTGGPAGATVDPSTARAALHDPTNAFWSQTAPEFFRVKVETANGFFVIEAHRDWAPRGADRFFNLVRAGFFDDSRFFRVDPRYIAQFGVPGDPAIAAIWRNQTFPDDPPKQSNLRGTIGFAASTNANSRTTQLYINLVDNVRNDAQGFALIGRVVEGMDVVDRLYSGYGENSGGGIRAGKQDRLFKAGNAWLDRDFPKLDKLVRATVSTNLPLILSIDENNHLQLGDNARLVALDELKSELLKATAKQPDLKLTLRVDKKASWNVVVRVMDIAKEANIKQGNVSALTIFFW